MKRILLALTVSFWLGCDSNDVVEIQIEDMNGMWKHQGEQDYLEIDEPNFWSYEWSASCYQVVAGTVTPVSGNKLKVQVPGEPSFEIAVVFEEGVMVVSDPESTDRYESSDQPGEGLQPVCTE